MDTSHQLPIQWLEMEKSGVPLRRLEKEEIKIGILWCPLFKHFELIHLPM